MSDIHGTGWGDDHDWQWLHTQQGVYSPFDKYSDYRCRNCHFAFRHFYDLVSDIFEAMPQAGVPEHCDHFISTGKPPQ